MTDDRTGRARILVIDDDPAMRQMLTTYLEQNNLAVLSAQGRRDMSSHFMRGEPDLVILDLHLGREEGLDLLREIRASSDVPVIIATGQRREEVDRVLGLELG
ncbi:response regulator, partial [Geminicoccus harenae]